MQTLHGDIWHIAQAGDALVVPTNIGYTVYGRKNVMGAGLAKGLVERLPGVAEDYGEFCYENRDDTPCILYKKRWNGIGIILFPTKPFLPLRPFLTWRFRSDLDLIERSLGGLLRLDLRAFGRVLVPLVGCGSGKRTEEEVAPLLEKYLGKRQKFWLVRRMSLDVIVKLAKVECEDEK